MKNFLTHITILFFLVLCSCSEPIKEFKINSDVQHVVLKLYEDSTFIEEVYEVEDNYEYSGNWKGSLLEDSIFITYTSYKKMNVLTTIAEKEYQIINGQAVLIPKIKPTDDLGFSDFLFKFYGDSIFQFSRIKFPLRQTTSNGYSYDYIDSGRYENFVELNKTDIKHRFKGFFELGNKYEISEMSTGDGLVDEQIILKGSEYYELRRFELIENKWMLTWHYINEL